MPYFNVEKTLAPVCSQLLIFGRQPLQSPFDAARAMHSQNWVSWRHSFRTVPPGCLTHQNNKCSVDLSETPTPLQVL